MRIMRQLVMLLALGSLLATASLAAPQEAPQVKKRVEPVYPMIYKMAGVEGEVFLQATVNVQGGIERIETIRSTNEPFELAAKEALKQWEFTPAMKDGQPIPMEVTIPFKFKLGNKGYASYDDEFIAIMKGIDHILKGEISDSVLEFVDPEAYVVVGRTQSHLHSLLKTKTERALLVEGPATKILSQRTIGDDSNSAAYTVLRTKSSAGKGERYHTVVMMKDKFNHWKIMAWHTSPQ